MYEFFGENEDVVFVECCNEEFVGCCDEVYVKSIFYYEEDFCGMGMSVGYIDVFYIEIKMCEGSVESVEFWKLCDKYLCCFLLVFIVGIFLIVEVVVDEVVYSDCIWVFVYVIVYFYGV